jgi:hypothetical protein
VLHSSNKIIQKDKASVCRVRMAYGVTYCFNSVVLSALAERVKPSQKLNLIKKFPPSLQDTEPRSSRLSTAVICAHVSVFAKRDSSEVSLIISLNKQTSSCLSLTPSCFPLTLDYGPLPVKPRGRWRACHVSRKQIVSRMYWCVLPGLVSSHLNFRGDWFGMVGRNGARAPMQVQQGGK